MYDALFAREARREHLNYFLVRRMVDSKVFAGVADGSLIVFKPNEGKKLSLSFPFITKISVDSIRWRSFSYFDQ